MVLLPQQSGVLVLAAFLSWLNNVKIRSDMFQFKYLYSVVIRKR